MIYPLFKLATFCQKATPKFFSFFHSLIPNATLDELSNRNLEQKPIVSLGLAQSPGLPDGMWNEPRIHRGPAAQAEDVLFPLLPVPGPGPGHRA